MPYQNYTLNPREEIRRFIKTYINYFNFWKKGDATPEEVTLTTPAKYPLREKDLPNSLKELIAEFRRSHPTKKIAFIKYMRSVNGKPELVVEDETGLPEEDNILTISRTVTINTADFVKVVTELFVAKKS